MFESFKDKDYEQNFFKEPKKEKPKKPWIKPVSDKRKEENKEYIAVKKIWRAARIAIDGGRCEFIKDGVRCSKRGDDSPHHRAGRVGRLLFDKDNFISLCRLHHRYCHDNPKWARDNRFITYVF